jgi:hypothetical protein
MQRALLTPRALVQPLRRCAVGSLHRRAPLAPRAGTMDNDALAAVRREAAARHAAAAAVQVAAAGPPSPAGAGAGAGSGAASAEAASLALAVRLQAEEDAAARRFGGAGGGSDEDDEVQIIDPPPKRQRQGPPSRAPAVADGIGFALTRCNSASAAHNVGAVSLSDIFPVRGCPARGRPGSA